MGNRFRYRKFVGEREFNNRFACPDEIKEVLQHADLTSDELPLNSAGTPFISDTKEAYLDNSDYHTLVLGATGSMKTRLFILPTMFALGLAGENMVVTDPKGELFDKTSGFLKEKGYDIHVLNLRDMSRSDCWNPFEEAYMLYNSGQREEGLKLASEFITTLMAPMTEKTTDLYWPESSKAYLNGCAEILIRGALKKEEANVVSMLNFLPYSRRADRSDISSLWRFIDSLPPQNLIRQNLESVAKNSPITLTCILGFVSTALSPFADSTLLQQISSKSTIDIHCFKEKDRKHVVYIIVPDETTTYHFFVSSFIKQIYTAAVSDAHSSKEGTLYRRLNFLLDEFANIPNISDMATMITAARSRNIRFNLVVQSDNQLKVNYGKDAETIKTNCLNWVYLASKEVPLIEQIRKLVGEENRELDSSPLISFFELSTLKKDFGEEGGAEAIVLISRCKAFKTFLPDISRYTQFYGRKPVELPHTDKTIAYFDPQKRCIDLKTGEILEIYDEGFSDFDPLLYKRKLPLEE
ncbi:MAG: type IV secretory system conjugative DNA transfer family protein [Bacilli bacterium]|nr:type IV secretory system conjugative DNA transfer family protein [Bacilli bacterium]